MNIKKLFPKKFWKGIFDPNRIGEQLRTNSSIDVNVQIASRDDETLESQDFDTEFLQTSILPNLSLIFDVYEAVDRYHTAFEEGQWDIAQEILKEIEASGVRLPRAFNLVDAQNDLNAVYQQIAQEEHQRLYLQEREQEYNVLRRMAQMKQVRPDRIWAALQIFQQTYYGYDPDNLIRFRPPLTKQELREQRRLEKFIDKMMEEDDEDDDEDF